MFEALLLRRVLKSGFLYQLCSKAYLEVLENYNEVSDAHTASPRMFAYQKTRKHPSKSDSRNSILLSKVVVSLAVLRGHRERDVEDTTYVVLQQSHFI